MVPRKTILPIQAPNVRGLNAYQVLCIIVVWGTCNRPQQDIPCMRPSFRFVFHVLFLLSLHQYLKGSWDLRATNNRGYNPTHTPALQGRMYVAPITSRFYAQLYAVAKPHEASSRHPCSFESFFGADPKRCHRTPNLGR